MEKKRLKWDLFLMLIKLFNCFLQTAIKLDREQMEFPAYIFLLRNRPYHFLSLHSLNKWNVFKLFYTIILKLILCTMQSGGSIIHTLSTVEHEG